MLLFLPTAPNILVVLFRWENELLSMNFLCLSLKIFYLGLTEWCFIKHELRALNVRSLQTKYEKTEYPATHRNLSSGERLWTRTDFGHEGMQQAQNERHRKLERRVFSRSHCQWQSGRGFQHSCTKLFSLWYSANPNQERQCFVAFLFHE